jgi:hypothetical protein
MEYLESEVNPVLAPLIKKLLAERPHGNAAIREAIMRLASEIEGSYPLSPEEVSTEFLSRVFGQVSRVTQTEPPLTCNFYI